VEHLEYVVSGSSRFSHLVENDNRSSPLGREGWAKGLLLRNVRP
jgi:hypothetical protein